MQHISEGGKAVENRPGERHLPVLDEPDSFARESLTAEPRGLQNPRKLVALIALAVLLVVTIIGTVSVVLRDLRLASASTASTGRAGMTIHAGTPTPDLSDPAKNGWSSPAPGAGTFGDIKFAPSNGQLGYACGLDETQTKRIFAIGTQGGDFWQVTASPAAYNYCWIQISPTNPRDVTLNSSVGPCSGTCPGLDAHYSTDGGQTWKAAPIPQNTTGPTNDGALWAGKYLYVWTPYIPGTTNGLFKVGAGDGMFTSIDPNALVPSARNAYLNGLVAVGAKLYVNLGYDGCNAQACTAIVASADGGKTWTPISHTLALQVVSVAGATLYGIVGGQADTLQRSDDGGETWTAVTLPDLPSGQTVQPLDGTFLPAPDGTLFAVDGQSIDYLRDGNWTAILFSTTGSAGISAISTDANGHLQRIWVLGAYGRDPHNQQIASYWHAVP